MGTTLTVSKCTESSNGGYVLTLKEKSPSVVVDTPFGKQSTSDTLNTFYMKVEDSLETGFSADINLNDYEIVEREFQTDKGKELILKWLHIK